MSENESESFNKEYYSHKFTNTNWGQSNWTLKNPG